MSQRRPRIQLGQHHSDDDADEADIIVDKSDSPPREMQHASIPVPLKDGDKNVTVPSEVEVEHDIHATTYENLISTIEETIKSKYNISDQDVRFDEIMFKEADYQVIWKERDMNMKRCLVSEEDTRYENFSDAPAKYTHTCKYDQNTSVSFSTSKGHKIGIGIGLGGNAGGATAGGNIGYSFSKSRQHGNTKSLCVSKFSSVEVPVQKNKAVIVKELTYSVKKNSHLYC